MSSEFRKASAALNEACTRLFGKPMRRGPKPPSRVGRDIFYSATEEEFAHKLAHALSVILEGFVDPYCMHLSPATGYWAHNHQDVQRWTGSFKDPRSHLIWTVGSWNGTLSGLNRSGFAVKDNRGTSRPDNAFQVEPIKDISAAAYVFRNREHPELCRRTD